jgi:hypothetical protein
MVAQLIKVRRGALVISQFQGFVRNAMVCEGQIKGVPLPQSPPGKQPQPGSETAPQSGKP